MSRSWGRVLDRELMKRADHPLVRSVRRIGLVAALKFDHRRLGKGRDRQHGHESLWRPACAIAF